MQDKLDSSLDHDKYLYDMSDFVRENALDTSDGGFRPPMPSDPADPALIIENCLTIDARRKGERGEAPRSSARARQPMPGSCVLHCCLFPSLHAGSRWHVLSAMSDAGPLCLCIPTHKDAGRAETGQGKGAATHLSHFPMVCCIGM